MKNKSDLTHFFLFILFLLVHHTHIEGFEKVVIWGHKTHSSTHSYIHKAFYEAFNFLGYATYWFDNDDQINDFDFSETLFLTEGQVDQKIPLRNDGIYILHNCSTKYEGLKSIFLQVYTDDVLLLSDTIQVDKFTYFYPKSKGLFMPWATNLLPYQIEEIKLKLPSIEKERSIYWVGTVGAGRFGNINELTPFIDACENDQHPFIAVNSSATGIDDEVHINFISSSYLAPAIVGTWQQQVGYIPCRIFKNISYGQLGVTNSWHAYELFEHKIVYNPDTYQLFYDAKKRLETLTLQEIYELMDLVKTKHTYLNRIQTIFDFLTYIGFMDVKTTNNPKDSHE